MLRAPGDRKYARTAERKAGPLSSVARASSGDTSLKRSFGNQYAWSSCGVVGEVYDPRPYRDAIVSKSIGKLRGSGAPFCILPASRSRDRYTVRVSLSVPIHNNNEAFASGVNRLGVRACARRPIKGQLPEQRSEERRLA